MKYFKFLRTSVISLHIIKILNISHILIANLLHVTLILDWLHKENGSTFTYTCYFFTTHSQYLWQLMISHVLFTCV